jgi:hypothetical protein
MLCAQVQNKASGFADKAVPEAVFRCPAWAGLEYDLCQEFALSNVGECWHCANACHGQRELLKYKKIRIFSLYLNGDLSIEQGLPINRLIGQVHSIDGGFDYNSMRVEIVSGKRG